MRYGLLAAFFLFALPAQAETPAAVAEMLKRAAGGEASVARGEALYRNRHTGGEVDACVSCHTDNPKAAGKHYRTGKPIEALAPAANPARFTDPAKVEKWFRRNCNDVLGRACSAAEKADFVAYMLSLK